MYRMAIVLTLLLGGCSVIGREAEGSYPPVMSFAPVSLTAAPSFKDDPIKGNDPIVGDWTTDPNVESVIGDWGSNGGLAPE